MATEVLEKFSFSIIKMHISNYTKSNILKPSFHNSCL